MTRGMVNPSEIKKALTPSELSNATLKAQKVDVTPPKEITKLAKSLTSTQKNTIADFLDDTSNLDNELKLRKMFGYSGLDENMSKIKLEQTASMLKDESMATKKKVVSSPVGEYLYHGTNEDVLDSITKNGLKPMSRGQLSLSKTEEYSKTFAREGVTPKGKTSAVMLRVKSDFLNGKTTTTRTDGKVRPVSDQINEILTKETIPPEAIEIYKNGKWESLVKSSTLEQEAKKYKSAEEFVKAQKENPIYKNFTQDIVGTSKVEKGNLLNAPDSGRYAWRAGRDASVLIDNADLPDNAFRAIVGKPRQEVQKSLDENLLKYEAEKNKAPSSDIKKIESVIKYAEETKSQLTDIWNKANKK